jgi:hypothetical protein
MFGQNRHNHLISEKVESLNFGINFVIIYKEKSSHLVIIVKVQIIELQST